MTVQAQPLMSEWTLEALRKLHDAPLMDLVFRAASVHRQHHDPNEVQMASLLSIKTGAARKIAATARRPRATTPTSRRTR